MQSGLTATSLAPLSSPPVSPLSPLYPSSLCHSLSYSLPSPECFKPEHTICIGVMPELKMSDGVFHTPEEFQRAKIKIWHTAVTEMFKNFNEVSKRLVRMMHMHFIALSLSRCNDAYVLTPLSPPFPESRPPPFTSLPPYTPSPLYTPISSHTPLPPPCRLT